MTWDTTLAWPFSNTHSAQFYARVFGVTANDLDVDFRCQPRPFLATMLLTYCLRDAHGNAYAESDVWTWTVSRRLQGLLTIGVRTLGGRLDLVVNCPDPKCGELLELPLSLTHFEQTDDPAEICCEPEKGVQLVIRSPAGLDQRRWWETGKLTESSHGSLARDLVKNVNGDAPPDEWHVKSEWLDAIGDALGQSDPLNDTTLSTTCLRCNREFDVVLDLELELLNALAEKQAALLDQIHQIAAVYHWSEAQILRLPLKRRQAYLRRTEEVGI